ncbi:MAG: family 16 glycosylhydrolase [Actinomycetia bacterium]|nr:family 16 glycosylhydrolase [Actinomycetes bacterium]MCH9801662.1 family 16 glycosylhydrolase [Actinomycetes bacterium]
MSMGTIRFCGVGLVTGAVVLAVLGSGPAASDPSVTAADQDASRSSGAGLQNGDFEDRVLSPWRNDSSGSGSARLIAESGDHSALLAPAIDGTARLVQTVSVRPNTEYSLSAVVDSRGATAALGVKGHQGKWTQRESADLPLNFRTADGVNEVEIYLQAWKRQSGTVVVDDVVLSDGTETPAPTPSVEPTPTVTPTAEPTATAEPTTEPSPSEEPTPQPTLTAPSSLQIENPDFDNGLDGWQDGSDSNAAATVSTGVLTLAPAADGTARVSQQVAVEPNSTYTIFLDRAAPAGDAAAYVKVKGHQGKWTEAEDDSRLVFTTGDVTEISLSVHAWKGQQSAARVDGVRAYLGDIAEEREPGPEPSSSPTPTPTAEPTPTPTPSDSEPTTSPTPEPTTPVDLGVDNPGFEDGLNGWTVESGSPELIDDAPEGASAIRLDPAPGTTVRLSQSVGGLEPRTKYTFAVKTRTTGDVWASFGVEQGVQKPKSNSVRESQWSEKRFTFYTGANDRQVNLYLQAYQTDVAGSVFFDDVKVVAGDLPVPEPPVGVSWPSAPETVSLPSAGSEIVRNGDFSFGDASWVVDLGSVNDGLLTLQSRDDRTARAVQDTQILLAASRAYRLTVRARAADGAPTVGIKVGEEFHHLQVNDGDWRDYHVDFTSPATQTAGKFHLERWKGDSGVLEVDSVSMKAVGGEWLDTPQPTPAQTTETLIEDFEGGLDPQKWLIVDRAWGGDNGGLIPENVSLADGVLKLKAQGDQYRGDQQGHGGRTTRVGAGIATRDYFASGKYVVRAKIPPELGAVSAFWNFHYIEHFPDEPEYWQEPSRIRNTEIDWEFPTDLSNGTMDDPISFQNGRANSWGGKLGGEGAHHPGRVDFGRNIADGEFHDFGIEWHSGGNEEIPKVIWTLDGEEVYRHEGAEYGQDNIPYRAARFWIGIWFPASGYKERVNGEYVDRVGWAGDPEFDTTVLEIDRVEITPFNEPNDAWVAETWPNGWYAPPSEYPVVGK